MARGLTRGKGERGATTKKKHTQRGGAAKHCDGLAGQKQHKATDWLHTGDGREGSDAVLEDQTVCKSPFGRPGLDLSSSFFFACSSLQSGLVWVDRSSDVPLLPYTRRVSCMLACVCCSVLLERAQARGSNRWNGEAAAAVAAVLRAQVGEVGQGREVLVCMCVCVCLFASRAGSVSSACCGRRRLGQYFDVGWTRGCVQINSNRDRPDKRGFDVGMLCRS
jgi:hypothetical protein